MTTNFDAFVARFVKLDVEKQELAKQAQIYFATKSEPLEDRWKLFGLLTNYLPVETYGDGHVSVFGEHVSLYDDFNIERHQTESYVSLLSLLAPDEWQTQEDLDEKGFTVEKLVKWKEMVLAGGYGSFTYDW